MYFKTIWLKANACATFEITYHDYMFNNDCIKCGKYIKYCEVIKRLSSELKKWNFEISLENVKRPKNYL